MCSTRLKLLFLVEDVEIVAKELLEYIGSSRPSHQDDFDADQLVALLKMKDDEVHNVLSIAKEQAEIQKRFEAVQTEVEKRDQDIRLLQRSLKETESILATAIYQAKQKLQAINQASSRKISSEELIKYAHKISASNAVAAPSTWNIGDPRRPYPTEIDMRASLLAKLSDLPFNSHFLHTGPAFSEFVGRQSAQIGTQQYSGLSSLTWQPSAEVQSMTVSSGVLTSQCSTTAAVVDSSKQHTAKDSSEDVELMSSDSSSSSSSDE
jgi:mediator of RNA polymerase II transcription subunit 4